MPNRKTPLCITMAVAVLFFALPAYGTYFMYRGKPPKFSIPARMELFARSPQLNRPFEYRKIYMPRMVTPVSTRAKSLPQFDLRPRPQSIYELRLEEFIAECERLISEDRHEIDTRPGDFMLFPSIPADTPSVRSGNAQSPLFLIAVARGSSWEPSKDAIPAASHLAGAAAATLGRDIRSIGAVYLDTDELKGVGLLIFSAGSEYDPSRNERAALADYLRSGGFIYLDNDRNGYTSHGFDTVMSRFATEQIDIKLAVSLLQPDHPLYKAFASSSKSTQASSTVVVPFAIRCNGRLAGVLGDYTLMTRWFSASEKSDSFKPGIELISHIISRDENAESAVSRGQN